MKFTQGSGVVKEHGIILGGDPDHHADCPIGNPAVPQHCLQNDLHEVTEALHLSIFDLKDLTV